MILRESAKLSPAARFACLGKLFDFIWMERHGFNLWHAIDRDCKALAWLELVDELFQVHPNFFDVNDPHRPSILKPDPSNRYRLKMAFLQCKNGHPLREAVLHYRLAFTFSLLHFFTRSNPLFRPNRQLLHLAMAL